VSEREQKAQDRGSSFSAFPLAHGALARSRSFHTARFRLYFRRRTRDKNRFGSRLEELVCRFERHMPGIAGKRAP
jgi:hypothetical protein